LAKKSREKDSAEQPIETDVKVTIWDNFWNLEKVERDEEVEDTTEEKKEFRWF
jgi:hypothetical protein